MKPQNYCVDVNPETNIILSLVSPIEQDPQNKSTTVNNYNLHYKSNNLSCFTETISPNLYIPNDSTYQIIATLPSPLGPTIQDRTQINKWSVLNSNLLLNNTFLFGATHENSLESEIVQRFTQFDKVRVIFFEEEPEITTIKILIDAQQYDYDLMTQIFSQAEFPIKDKFETNKALYFRYIFGSFEKQNLGQYGTRILFGK